MNVLPIDDEHGDRVAFDGRRLRGWFDVQGRGEGATPRQPALADALSKRITRH